MHGPVNIRFTSFMFSNLFRKLCRLWDNIEEYVIARHNTGDNIKLHGKLQGYRQILRIVIIIFPQKQWLHESNSVLLDMYFVLLTFNINVCITSKIVQTLKSFQNKIPALRQPLPLPVSSNPVISRNLIISNFLLKPECEALLKVEDYKNAYW